MNIQENFLTNLRREMAARAVTGRELAKRTGIHEVSLYRIVNGTRCPRIDTCQRLADALGVRPDLLFLEPSSEDAA